MADKIENIQNMRVDRQFEEILNNITEKNFQNDKLTLTSDDGSKYLLKVQNDGTLYTEEV